MESSKLKLNRRASAVERETGLFKHFKIASREEHLENVREENERITELRARNQEKQRLAMVMRDERKRVNARKRKQQQRERERKYREREKKASKFPSP